jgi:hypothetical protein
MRIGTFQSRGKLGIYVREERRRRWKRGCGGETFRRFRLRWLGHPTNLHDRNVDPPWRLRIMKSCFGGTYLLINDNLRYFIAECQSEVGRKAGSSTTLLRRWSSLLPKTGPSRAISDRLALARRDPGSVSEYNGQ